MFKKLSKNNKPKEMLVNASVKLIPTRMYVKGKVMVFLIA